MTNVKHLQYVGGPFAGGIAPDDSTDGIYLHSPLGTGTYVLTQDEATGTAIYLWESAPQEDS